MLGLEDFILFFFLFTEMRCWFIDYLRNPAGMKLLSWDVDWEIEQHPRSAVALLGLQE